MPRQAKRLLRGQALARLVAKIDDGLLELPKIIRRDGPHASAAQRRRQQARRIQAACNFAGLQDRARLPPAVEFILPDAIEC